MILIQSSCKKVVGPIVRDIPEFTDGSREVQISMILNGGEGVVPFKCRLEGPGGAIMIESNQEVYTLNNLEEGNYQIHPEMSDYNGLPVLLNVNWPEDNKESYFYSVKLPVASNTDTNYINNINGDTLRIPKLNYSGPGFARTETQIIFAPNSIPMADSFAVSIGLAPQGRKMQTSTIGDYIVDAFLWLSTPGIALETQAQMVIPLDLGSELMDAGITVRLAELDDTQEPTGIYIPVEVSSDGRTGRAHVDRITSWAVLKNYRLEQEIEVRGGNYQSECGKGIEAQFSLDGKYGQNFIRLRSLPWSDTALMASYPISIPAIDGFLQEANAQVSCLNYNLFIGDGDIYVEDGWGLPVLGQYGIERNNPINCLNW